jgi:hypothetical protein
MTDLLQFGIVTAAAASALVAIARPYFGRRQAGSGCATCPSASRRVPARTSPGVHTLHVLRSSGTRRR